MPLAANCCVALAKSFTLKEDHTTKNNIKNNSRITTEAGIEKAPPSRPLEKRFNPEYSGPPGFLPGGDPVRRSLCLKYIGVVFLCVARHLL
jgi:hypothetical protein